MGKGSGLRRVLIITYYWPPSGGAGVQRWLKFSKYLREYGWEPVIYTPENPEAPSIDDSLLQDIPAGIEVIKLPIVEPYAAYKRFVGMKQREKVNSGFLQEKEKPGFAENISVWLRGNLFIPDARRFWIKPSVKFLKKYLSDKPVSAIVSTGPPHSMHMIAYYLHKKLNIPWLADFRDPWTGIDFYHQLKLTKLADHLHHSLEKKVLQSADSVVVISNEMVKDFRVLWEREYKLVTNGYDEQDIVPLTQDQLDTKFTISHIGSLNAARNPEMLWKSLSELIKSDPNFAADLRIKLVGKVDIGVLKNLTAFELHDYLNKIVYLPHKLVVQEIQKSQVLLLLINNTPNSKGITTGKIFEYIASGRPILNIGPVDGDAAAIINHSEAGVTVEFENKEEIKSSIKELYKRFKENRLTTKSEISKEYSRRTLAGKIAGILDTIAS